MSETPDFYTRNHIDPAYRGRLIELRSQEKLLRNAFHYMKEWRRMRGTPLWVFVGQITGHGSGYSQQICEELGWDYDMKITPAARLPDPKAAS